MALSNAERQKRWRDKRNALAKQAEVGLAKGKPFLLRNDKLIEQFCANAGALVDGLITEGDKDPATFSPNTVRRLSHLLKRQVGALRNGDELPELSPSERRQKKERLRLDEPLQRSLAPRHSSNARRKAGRTRVIDAGVSANVGSGAYEINVAPGGYSVSYSPDSRHPLKKRRTLDGLFPTVEEAKAAAERDRRKLKDTNGGCNS